MTSIASARPDDDPGQALNRAAPKLGGRAERFHQVICVLERDRKILKSRLYAILGVSSPSSFKRVKAELNRMGLPLEYDRVDRHFHIPADASSIRHGVDVRTRAQVAQVRVAVTALGGVAQEALEDVLAVLDARIALEDPEALAVMTSRHPQPAGDAEFYRAHDRVLSAVRDRQWLSFDYARTAGGERTARTIAPYAVHAHDGRYYVWGVPEGAASPYAAPRLFALDRMSEVTLEPDHFDFDASLDLDTALRHSFGIMVSDEPPQDVVVRVSPEAAAFVACRRWPAQSASEHGADGSLTVTFNVSKIEELVAWVLSFGGAATIVSPAYARDALRARAAAIVTSIDADDRA